jgi:hypothetical protein
MNDDARSERRWLSVIIFVMLGAVAVTDGNKQVGRGWPCAVVASNSVSQETLFFIWSPEMGDNKPQA